MTISRRGATAAVAGALLPASLFAQPAVSMGGAPGYSTGKLDAAVKAFKAEFGEQRLYGYGQFFVTNTMQDSIRDIFENLIRLDPVTAAFPEVMLAQIKQVQRALDPVFRKAVSPSAQLVADVMASLPKRNPALALEAKRIFAAVTPNDADRKWAATTFADIWTNDNLAPPTVFSLDPTIGRWLAAYGVEKDKCDETTRALARKLSRRRGINSVPRTVFYAAGAIANAKVVGAKWDGHSPMVPIQFIAYASPPQLGAFVNSAKLALDARVFVKCGALSGTSHENAAFPLPEHFVLLFAYDTIAGSDAFVFWDSDSARSNIRGGGGTGWGTGFGMLFFREGRLSTATDASDLIDIDVAAASDSFGNHVRDGVRHRYQIYQAQTIVN